MNRTLDPEAGELAPRREGRRELREDLRLGPREESEGPAERRERGDAAVRRAGSVGVNSWGFERARGASGRVGVRRHPLHSPLRLRAVHAENRGRRPGAVRAREVVSGEVRPARLGETVPERARPRAAAPGQRPESASEREGGFGARVDAGGRRRRADAERDPDGLEEKVRGVFQARREESRIVAKFNSSKLELISNVADKQAALNQLVIEGSSVFVKLCYSGLFLIVVIALLIVTQKALYSPWGRMMRAIRDNEEAANAMGKNVVKHHLLIFILGSAIVGIAGAMLVTQDGLFTPGSYRPMRYTFLIWVMVIVGGSGNNFGAILGGFAVWFLWIEAAPIALFLINLFTSGMSDTHALKIHLIESVPYFRYLMMGLGLLLIMRYRPKGILPEKIEIK